MSFLSSSDIHCISIDPLRSINESCYFWLYKKYIRKKKTACSASFFSFILTVILERLTDDSKLYTSKETKNNIAVILL
jgi:hypothetical protein